MDDVAMEIYAQDVDGLWRGPIVAPATGWLWPGTWAVVRSTRCSPTTPSGTPTRAWRDFAALQELPRGSHHGHAGLVGIRVSQEARMSETSPN